MEPSLLQRLAFVKYLHSLALAQCKAPEPLSSAGLLTLHDSIELFLQLAAEHLNVTEKTHDLKDYWGPISARLPGGRALSYQVAIQRLNKARVALKHHGTHPSKLDLDSFRAATEEFFNENAPLVFGVRFDEVSMLEFVQPEEARERMEKARRHHLDGEFDLAAGELAIAFEVMIDDYGERKEGRFQRSPYYFGPSMAFARSDLHGLDLLVGRSASRSLKDTLAAVEAMQGALRVMAIGLDFRRYSRFRSFMPAVIRTNGSTYQTHDWPNDQRNSETIQFCMDFIIESAIRLREFDYDA